jgi:PAS domain S-box-containing protein
VTQPSANTKNSKPPSANLAEECQQLFAALSDGVLVFDLETGQILAANPAAAEMHGYSLSAISELRIQRLIHPKSLQYFAGYEKIIQQGGLFEMQVQHVCCDETLMEVEWRAVAHTYRGSTCALAVLRDVSKRIQAEHQLQQRVGIRAHEQTILLEISQTLASTLELQPGQILDQLGVLIQYTHAALFTLESYNLVTLAVRGTERLQNSLPFSIRLENNQALETIFSSQHPIRIADIWSNDPAARLLRSVLEKDSAALLEEVQSWMWVPLAVRNRIIGGFGIAHTGRNYFTPHHADLSLSVANQAAITMLNAQLYGHAQELAVLEERQRLARNLHDAVNQSLFSAGLIAEVLPRLWDRDQAEARRSLEDLRRLTRGAQAEMRALLAELRPSTLTDSDLGDLLRLLGNALTGRTNIPVKLTIKGESDLPADTQVILYRICQEALNNIAKHAKASLVEIDVLHCKQPKQLELHIRDNGRGFDPAQPSPSGHYGLGMMRERAETVGASLNVTSQPGEGTDITLIWTEIDPRSPKENI